MMSIGGRHQSLRLIVLRRAGFRCEIGGQGCTGIATEADHMTPRLLGGQHRLDNYRAACRHCNAAAGARLGNARRRVTRDGRAAKNVAAVFSGIDQDPAACFALSPITEHERMSSP